MPALQGSSRITGGILRGNALGNVFNHGDTEFLTLQAASAKGIIRVYDALVKDPGNAAPKMFFKIGVCPTLGPVLKMFGKRAPYIEGQWFFAIYFQKS